MSGRESFGTIVGEMVDSLPLDGDSRNSISDLGKLLFGESQQTNPNENVQALSNSYKTDAAPKSNATSANHMAPTTSSSLPMDPTATNKRSRNDNRPADPVGNFMSQLSASADTGRNQGAKHAAFQNGIKGVPRQKAAIQYTQQAVGAVQMDGPANKILRTKVKAKPNRWTPEEDDALRAAVKKHSERNWKLIAEEVHGRNHTQCLQRWTKVLAPGLVKGHWRPEEDDLLRKLVAEGRKNWGQVAARIPGRTSKQCRERWYNHLDPNIVRGEYTAEEDRIIIEAQMKLGNRWSAISAMLPGRTEDAVKIRWKSLCRTKSGRNTQAAAAAQKQAQQHAAVSHLPVTGPAQQFMRLQQDSIKAEPHMQSMVQPQGYMNPAAAFATQMRPMGASPYVPDPMLMQGVLNTQQHVMNPNPAALFMQQQQQQLQQQQMHHLYQTQQNHLATQHHEQQAWSAQSQAQTTTAPTGSIYPEKRIAAKASYDAAAKASAARRTRDSVSGRGSIDGFLHDLGDVGRMSDMDLGTLGPMDEVWRMSDNMERLSL